MATGQDQRACDEGDPPYLTNEDLLANLDAEVRKWDTQTKHRPIKFVVAGRGGIGKTALVQNLMSIGSGKSVYSGKPDTVVVTKHENTIRMVNNDVDVIAFDMPGLGDHQHVDEVKVTDDLEEQTGGSVDIFLYCSSLLPGNRVADEDRTICQLFTNAFGKSLWKKAIYVMTFANCVNQFAKQLSEEEYKDLTSNYYERFKQTLKEIGIPEDVREKIPCCAAGNEAVNLPIENRDNWQDHLYFKIIERADSSITPALVKYRWGAAALGMSIGAGAGAVSGAGVGSIFGPVGAVTVGVAGAIGGAASASGYGLKVGDQINKIWIKKLRQKEDMERIKELESSSSVDKKPIEELKENEQSPTGKYTCLLY